MRAKSSVRWLLILLLSGVSACSSVGGGSFCRVAEPILPDRSEEGCLTDGTVEQILKHNEKGERLCKWKTD